MTTYRAALVVILIRLNSCYSWQQQIPQSTPLSRREAVLATLTSTSAAVWLSCQEPAIASTASGSTLLLQVTDPHTYSALAYAPPHKKDESDLPPLILVLHGAGKNDQDMLSDLGSIRGEHAGLIPSLIQAGQAPQELIDNCAVLAPYSYGSPSFYEEPRSKLLSFVQWASSPAGKEAGCPLFDPSRIIILGFSDGATVAVELLTTGRFAGGVICSYGFTGSSLPELALQRLANIPVWVFHSADDVIYDVRNSDRLVQQLRKRAITRPLDTIRYSRYDKDPEGFTGSVRGHTMGITASKLPELYEWMQQVPPRK
jgi:predicted peptidase